MDALFVSTAAVAIAEIGDKTMLLALILAARYRRPWAIVAGIAVATLANHALAGWAGAWVASMVSPEALKWGVVACFAAVAAWTLVPDTMDEDDAPKPSRFGAFLATTVAFFIVEIGDKTQIATVVLAAKYDPLWQVVAGTSLGMLLANGPVVLLGHRYSDRLPLKAARYTAAALFAALALWVAIKGLGEVEAIEAPASTSMATISAPVTTGSLRPPEDIAAFVENPGTSPGPTRRAHPPLGTEPASVVQALLPAARAGDPSAACRLAVELQACATLIAHGDAIDRAMSQQERRAESSGDLVSTLWTVDVRHLAARHAGRCRDVDVDALLSERDWLWEAARRGHAESALRFLAGQSIGYEESFRTLEIPPYTVMRHPNWPAWQARASALAEAMGREGRSEVHYFLSSAYGGDDSPFDALYPDDPVERAAHLLALRAAMPSGTPTADAVRGLRPEQVEAARLRAAQLRPATSRTSLDREALNRALESPLALVVRDDDAPPHPAPCEG